MTMTLRQAAGSLLVVGLSGIELTSLERAWLRVVRPGGIILFRRNIVDVVQTRTLLDESTGLCAPHAFRCVDVEGGTVDRLRDVLAPMPSAQAVAIAARQTSKSRASLARQHGELIARGVKAFGFNTTLAPVLDLALPASREVMGTRSAAPDAAGVIEYARDFLAGLAARGVAGCGKHFPGLGGGTRDSHLETPAIERTWEEIWKEDLVPYRELRAELPMIMVNHAAYPKTKSKAWPASASAFWITKVLRERMNYRGLVFSDDLEMGGILKFLSMEKAVVAAVKAGMDTVEICHSPELILRAYEALLAEAERSPAFATLITARASESARKRRKLFQGPPARALSTRQFDSLRASVQKFVEVVMKTSANDSQGSGVRAAVPLVERA